MSAIISLNRNSLYLLYIFFKNYCVWNAVKWSFFCQYKEKSFFGKTLLYNFFTRFLKMNSISRSIRPSWTLFATKIRQACYAVTETMRSKLSHFWTFRLFFKLFRLFNYIEHGYDLSSKFESKKLDFTNKQFLTFKPANIRISKNFQYNF
jgi:hypothetical protein